MGRFNKIVSKRGNETGPVVSVKCLGYQFSKEYLIRVRGLHEQILGRVLLQLNQQLHTPI